MRLFLRHILLSLVAMVATLQVAAQDANEVLVDADSIAVNSIEKEKKTIKVSVLTCTAGDELYSKFGHTALLVQREGDDDGMVFNYGCFDYNADSFVMKFVLGHTDYVLNAESYNRFIFRYGYFGIGVYEQELNLSEKETERLTMLLYENLLPENQMYRYNWLYNNCTEKARDVVEMAIDGKVEYTRKETHTTVREMLRECLKNEPWESFGIDLVLGEEIDRIPDKRVQMFLPAFYMAEVDEAIKDGMPFVKSKRQIMPAQNVMENQSFMLSPTFVFGALFIVVCLVSLYEFKRRENLACFDMILHILQGLAGVLVAFLFFFSEHPAVDSNWLVVIFNPIPLFYAGWIIFCKRNKRDNILAYINLGVLAAFLITMMICRQSFNIATYFIVLAMLTRALMQSHNAYHKIR